MHPAPHARARPQAAALASGALGLPVPLEEVGLGALGDARAAVAHGHAHLFVHAVGLDTYLRLMEETIKQMKGDGKAPVKKLAEASVDGTALIPDWYVPDEAQKLNFYRRLSREESLTGIDAVRRELRDRYGPIPPEVETLLDTAALRMLGTELGIERILVRPWDARLNFRAGVVPRMVALQRVFSDRQLEVELVRPLPLSLVLHRRGPEPVGSTLIVALRTLAQDKSLAA